MKNKVKNTITCFTIFFLIAMTVMVNTVYANSQKEQEQPANSEKIRTVELCQDGVSQNGVPDEEREDDGAIRAETGEASIVYEGTDGDLEWSIDVDGHLTVTGENKANHYGWSQYKDQIKTATFDVTGMTSTSGMFSWYTNLVSVDLSGLDTSNVTNMSWMFVDCSSLKTLDLSSFDTSNVTDMSLMFYGCSSLTSLDVKNFKTENVTNMELMFWGCSSLTSLDASNFITENVTNMESMFLGCSSLTGLDVRNFSTENVTNMESMFLGCNSLVSMDVSNFNTSNVTNMSSMFGNCNSLVNLDVSNFNTSNVTNMSGMFGNCNSLVNLDVSNFNTSNVTNMSSMFGNCNSLECLDLSSFDTCNVLNMNYMFARCKSLVSLNLSCFDVGQIATIDGLLDECEGLLEIKSPKNLRSSVALPYNFFDISQTNVWFDSDGNECKAMSLDRSDSVFYTRKVQWLKENNTSISLEESYYLIEKAIEPSPIVKYREILLQQGKDYSLSYENNKAVGVGTVIITGQGKYTGTLRRQLKIDKLPETIDLLSCTFIHSKGNRYKLGAKTYYRMVLRFQSIQCITDYTIELSDYRGNRIKYVDIQCKPETNVRRSIKNLSQDVYGVRIRGTKDGWCGKWSDRIYVIKQPKAQARIHQGSIQIKWQKLKGVSGYEIYMKKGGNFKKIATTSKNVTQKTINNFQKKKLSKGTDYFYVVAKKKVGKKVYRSSLNYRGKILLE